MTNVTEESDSELSNLLNPENLSEESLIHILQQRQVMIDDVDRSNKENLVSLFHRTVTPQPQRVMPKNRIGKVLKSAQEKVASRKRKSIETPNLPTAAKSTASIGKVKKNAQEKGASRKRKPIEKPNLLTAAKSTASKAQSSSANIQSRGYRSKQPPVVLNKKDRTAKLKRTGSSQQEGEHPNGNFALTVFIVAIAIVAALGYYLWWG
ncbi:ashwin-like [Anneissia japonica]|uniref:ashwin-like n=1 Tax=Anneissia japonica TaxID=1529436 RepID=UPI001425516B|nr:ashwin-like [Anneissia japonica]XP_033120466.1 ashwin-like [Anneissia japonica]XP_033120468.1 ashwin-like [Anneissia japonica]